MCLQDKLKVTRPVLKYFCPLVSFSLPYATFDLLLRSHNWASLEVWLVLKFGYCCRLVLSPTLAIVGTGHQ